MLWSPTREEVSDSWDSLVLHWINYTGSQNSRKDRYYVQALPYPSLEQIGMMKGRHSKILIIGFHMLYALIIIFSDTTIIKLLWLFCQRGITLWFGLFWVWKLFWNFLCEFYNSIYRFLHLITEHPELCRIVLNPGVSE